MSLLRMGNDQRILEPPAEVRWPSARNCTQVEMRLHRAVLAGKLHKIRDLVTRGCSVDGLNEDGQTALFCAAFRGSAEVVNLLLSLGAKPNARCQPEGHTAVHAACFNGDPDILKMLLQAGGDLRLCDGCRRTPIDWIAFQPDSMRQTAIKAVVDRARLCTTETSGLEVMKVIQNDLSPRSNKVLSEVMRTIFRKSVIVRDTKSRTGVNVNMDELYGSVHSTGFGKVYYGTGERCAAVVGLPYISEVSELEDERNEDVPAWMCGKFSSFHPKYWSSRKTPVTVRNLYAKAGVNAVPDILIQELEARSKLHHPNLLMLLGICQMDSGESLSLVYERVNLGSLYSILHVEKKKLTQKFATDVIFQICDALEYVHAMKMIHCGISSHSIVLVSSGVAKLSCFEYALPENVHGEASSCLKHPILTSNSHMDALKHWMAPEVLLKQQYSVRSDVYSLICVMWEICAGDIPWRSFSLENLRTVFLNESQQPLHIDKTSIPKYWCNLMDVGLRLNREQRDLELVEIKDMLEMSLKPRNPYKYSKVHLGTLGIHTPEKAFSSPKGIRDEVDVTKATRCGSDGELDSAELMDSRIRSVGAEPQGILKKFGRSKPSTNTLNEAFPAERIDQAETVYANITSSETQTETLNDNYNELDPPAQHTDEENERRGTKKLGAIHSLAVDWMKPPSKKVLHKAIATQTEVRSIRKRISRSSSESNSSVSSVTSPTSASTPLWEDFGASPIEPELRKKTKMAFKEKLSKLMQSMIDRHRENAGSSFGSLKEKKVVRPASHFSVSVFSTDTVPQSRNYLGGTSSCRSHLTELTNENTSVPAIKPAGHSLGLEIYPKVNPRKLIDEDKEITGEYDLFSRSHLDLPVAEKEDVIHPGFVTQKVEKFNSYAAVLEKPTDFHHNRTPWEVDPSLQQITAAISQSEEKKPLPISKCSIAIQCMMEELSDCSIGTSKRDTWSQSSPYVMTENLSRTTSVRKSVQTSAGNGVQLQLDYPLEGPEPIFTTSAAIPPGRGQKKPSDFELHDAVLGDDGDTAHEDLYLTAFMSPITSPTNEYNDVHEVYENEEKVPPVDEAEDQEQIEAENPFEGGLYAEPRQQSSSFTFGGNSRYQQRKTSPNRTY